MLTLDCHVHDILHSLWYWCFYGIIDLHYYGSLFVILGLNVDAVVDVSDVIIKTAFIFIWGNALNGAQCWCLTVDYVCGTFMEAVSSTLFSLVVVCMFVRMHVYFVITWGRVWLSVVA